MGSGCCFRSGQQRTGPWSTWTILRSWTVLRWGTPALLCGRRRVDGRDLRLRWIIHGRFGAVAIVPEACSSIRWSWEKMLARASRIPSRRRPVFSEAWRTVRRVGLWTERTVAWSRARVVWWTVAVVVGAGCWSCVGSAWNRDRLVVWNGDVFIAVAILTARVKRGQFALIPGSLLPLPARPMLISPRPRNLVMKLSKAKTW